MMDCTDRFDRYFLRLISRHALLYTEMIAAAAIRHGDRAKFLAFDSSEHPLALQVGGSDAAELAEAARVAQEWGYDEINLNVGCPSDRVRSGHFGACLMVQPEIVARSVEAMIKAAPTTEVTVKCRLGVDDQNPRETLPLFIDRVRQAGCRTFIIHARKAWLEGLSPKENRELPPLDYALVHEIKARFPDLAIILNGGIMTLDEAESHMAHVDGVMLGRAAYQNPYLLADVDRRIFGGTGQCMTRHDIVERMLPYIERELSAGVPLHRITRHMLGLFKGVPGAARWRRHLSEHAQGRGAGIEVLLDALTKVAGDVDARKAA